MAYKLLLSNTAETLSKYVNDMLEQGWVLYGPPVATVTGDGIRTVYFAQAVTHAG